MTTVVVLSNDSEVVDELLEAFSALCPDLLAVAADDPRSVEAQVAACWYPPTGYVERFPSLRLIHSVSAGVEHLGLEHVSSRAHVCRIVDPDQRQGMIEYVRWAVLQHHRGFGKVMQQQSARMWKTPPQVLARDYAIGVMGLGTLGSAVAVDMAAAGYAVRGWSRQLKHLPEVRCFAGRAGLAKFLDGLNCVINLLPLTSETQQILNQQTLGLVSNKATVINCGRGAHIEYVALAEALLSGKLDSAVLDVFEVEPLPKNSPLWYCPGITITPHMASAASNVSVVHQVADNVVRLTEGRPLLNQVDLERGY
ncbi:glyoxylate/hydroxypyruvate reductase A [Pseudomonas sp. L13]|uniref:2-hydroxyacid dehydrogenase n=1 Tax=Pseudomonas sp. L13 TaxID=343985 RepID=UPI00137B85AF|nr:glyoxylate/hydroxypyruvate reductase A [Pseudomonas sp. L13]NCE89194.1 glyoxylate/hydroxypyruvate reductase A [Pseudomonas sp. L13]